MTVTFDGQLEIDPERGVVYFHRNDGTTLLRVCRLNSRGIERALREEHPFIDITFGHVPIEEDPEELKL